MHVVTKKTIHAIGREDAGMLCVGAGHIGAGLNRNPVYIFLVYLRFYEQW